MRQLLFAFAFLGSSLAAGAQNQALSQLVYEIRNPQTDAAHFRQAVEKIGEYLALEVLEELNAKDATITTVTGAEAKHKLIDETPVLVTILRAGLPLNAGIHKVFPNAEVGFFAMARNEETLKAAVHYVALTNLKNQTVILSDTLLATGGSILNAIQEIEKHGPKRIYIISAIASKTGIEQILRYRPDIKIFAAAIDPGLNDKGYISPGLGDAGDRSFGKKIELSSEHDHE